MPNHYSRVTLTCRRCGVVFTVERNRAETAKYCGNACKFAPGNRVYPGRHGEAGMRRTPEYIAWWSIKHRCLNPRANNYQHYGGRGITVCDRWRDSYEAFLADMGRRPGPDYSIDRIDVNAGYVPGNVRWAPPTEQQGNKRLNRRITFDGVERTAAEWARVVGLSGGLLRARLATGWSVERVLTTPAEHDPKLPAEAVRAIRERYARGGITYKRLAAEYGISPAMVCLVVQRKVRADVA